MRHELDHIDEQIIKLLHDNARTPLKSIASQVFLSSPAVSARIERLEQAGGNLCQGPGAGHGPGCDSGLFGRDKG